MLAANVMRSMAAREQGEEAQGHKGQEESGAASVAQVVMPKPELPIAPVASVSHPSGEMGIQRQCSACQQGMEFGKDSDEMSSGAGIQTKLTVGAVGDRYEQEADRMAAQVMSMSVAPDHSPQVQRFGEEDNPVQRWSLAQSITPVVQRQADEQVQMRSLVQRAFQAGGNEASGDLESRLNASKGGGNALAPEVRAFMEPRFGADFSSVRVHTGSDAVQMNRELGAQAFAHGSDVYFGAGKSPGNNELTAHELTHVVQQTDSSINSSIQRVCGVNESCMEEPNASYAEPNASYLEPNYTSAKTPNYTPAQANASYAPPLSQKNQNQNQSKAPTIDPAKVKEAADAIFKAVDGWGTDEDAIMKALAGKNPEEIAAIKKEYADHYNGRNLDDDLQSELSGDDLKEAQAHLSGDRATAAVEALSNSIGVFNDDEEKIEETLTALSPEDINKMQEMAAKNPAVKAKLDQVLSHLGGEDKEVTEALLKGNKEEASAIRIADAIEGLGTDEKAVYKYIEGKTPKELEDIKKAYKNKTGRTIETDIEDDFSDAEKDRASALASGDKAAATAAQIKEAAEGMGTDEKGIYDQLKDKSETERKEIIKAYEDKYGKGSFDAMLEDELSGDDLKQAQQYRDQGKLDLVFALKLGIEGLGTDEDLIKETLKGKNADEIKAIRDAYLQQTGRNLDIDLAGEVDGRDAFEIGQMLKGKPQTPEEEYQRALERYEFERGEGSTAFSRAMMDSAEFLGMHSKGEMLEYQTQRLRHMFDENGKLKPDFTEEDVQKIAGYQETDATNYKNAKEAVGNAISTAGTIAVAALVTVCTKGAAAPWLIVVISGLAGGGANMAIKYGMQGTGYGGEDIAIDALTTAITAAISGSLAEKTAFLAKLEQIADVFGDEMAKKVALEALKGTVKGATSGAIQEVMNDNNWREGIAEYLAGIGKGAALGGAIGGTTAAASAGVKVGLDGKTSSAMTEGSAAIAGAVVNEGVSVIKGDYKGRLEDLLGRLLVAGVSAAAEDKATSLASQARMSAIAQLVVAAGDDMPKVQQILEAQVKYLTPEEKAHLRAIILSETLNKSPDMSQSSTANHESIPQVEFESPTAANDNAIPLSGIAANDNAIPFSGSEKRLVDKSKQDAEEIKKDFDEKKSEQDRLIKEKEKQGKKVKPKDRTPNWQKEQEQLAATSRAQPPSGEMTDHFENIVPRASENAPRIKGRAFPGIEPSETSGNLKIRNTDDFIDALKGQYQRNGDLPLHPTLEARIREVFVQGKEFPELAGVPGLHAEVRAANAALHQLNTQGIPITPEVMGKTAIATHRLTPIEQTGARFPACHNCTSILDAFNILTGLTK